MHRCRNISVLQSCLSKITLIREKDLDRARRYYELFYLNDEVREVGQPRDEEGGEVGEEERCGAL